jgi:predicted nucleic acid-binding protein
MNYRVYVSDTVVEEASRGNEDQAQKRLHAVKLSEVLEISEAVQILASHLLLHSAIPEKCPEDALHIACAAVNKIEIILTWNFKHINNPLAMPVICSPEEFL